MTSAIEVRSLEKRFAIGLLRRHDVLRGIDFTLAAGERCLLIGPNGSGKSTLLRILAGVEPPSTGALRILGGSPDDASTRARIGYVADVSPFPPELSAHDALALVAGLYVRNASEARQRVRSALQRVGLAECASRPLGRFSRGMLKRVGLAQAFLQAPDILLLDEPRAGLDLAGGRVLEELLAEAGARGATLLIASHDAGLVSEPEDHVLVLVDGRLVADGSVEQMADRTNSIRWCVSGLDPAARGEIEAHVERLGGRIHSRGPDDVALGEWMAEGSRPSGSEENA